MALSAGAVVAQFDGDFSGLNKGIKQAENNISGFVSGINNAGKNIGKAFTDIGKSLENVGKSISLKVTAPLVGAMGLVSAQAINQVKQVQNASAGLRAYEKDAGKVTSTLQDLVKFAQSDTGVLFQRQDLFDAASTLKMYGNETGTLVDKVKILSKGVAMGKTTFQELATIIGRVGASGKLTATDFDMLIDRGIGLDKSMRGTNITTEKLFQALDKVLPAELLEGRANTIEGQMIRLQSAFRNVGHIILGTNKDANGFMPGSIGERIFQAIDALRQFVRSAEFLDMVKRISDRVVEGFEAIEGVVRKVYDAYMQLSPGQRDFIADMIVLAGVLGPVLIAVGGLAKIIGIIIGGIPTLLGIGALAGIFTLIKDNTDLFTNALDKAKNAFKAFGAALDFVFGSGYVDDWIEFSGQDEDQPITLFLLNLSNGFIAVKDAINQTITTIQDFWKKNIDPVMTVLKILGGIILMIATQVLAAFLYAWEQLKDPVMQLASAFMDFWRTVAPVIMLLLAILTTLLLPIVQMVFATAVQIIKGAVTGITGILDVLTGIFKVVIGVITGIFTGDFSKAVEGFQQIFRGLGTWIKGAFDIILSPFRGIIDGIKNTFTGINFFKIAVEWMNKLIDGIKSKIGNIGGSIKEGIGKMLPEGVRKLIPGFADGVRNFSGGLAIVGERGPELVNLPKGADVFTNEESRRMTSGGGITIETMNIKSGVDWELGASYMAQKLRLS
jgi:hypothetical protein